MPDPCNYDSEDEFHSVCVAARQEEDPSEYIAQSNAVCYSMWANRDCSGKAASKLIHKVGTQLNVEKAAAPGTYSFVISSEDPDLVNDIVVQAGLTPVSDRIPAQVDHSGDMDDMIGLWKNIRRVGKQTHATLELFDAGISKTADMIRALLTSGVRLAASIGFRPLEFELIKGTSPQGYRYTKSILTEVSVVVVPAHPQALSVIKAFGFSPEAFATSGKPVDTLQRAKAAILAAKRTTTRISK
jgi:hypothetical protein